MLEPIRKVFRVPGLAAAVVKDGRLAGIGATGIRRVGSDARLEIDDPFHLGSCGKAVTATVAAIVVEKGTMDWTTTIREVYPEFEPTMQSYFQGVTLRDLLAHRGGFGGRDQVFDSDIARFGGDLTHQRAELVRYSVARTPAYEPRTQFGYSDIGYSIAGAMVGKRAARPFEQLVRDVLAGPLGLETLGFGAPGLAESDPVPHGHITQDGALVALGVGPGEDLANPAIGPAGTIHMSLRDWSTFAMFHLRGARGEDTKLLSPAGFQALHADTFEQGYGLGWFLTANKWGEGRALTHTGSCGAWAALIWVLPEENAAILVATNFGGGNGYQALQLAADKLGHGYLKE